MLIRGGDVIHYYSPGTVLKPVFSVHTHFISIGNSMICSDINFGINTTSDISKLLYVISQAVSHGGISN